jgi:hypothetical protein
MLKRILTYGLVAGLIVGAPMLAVGMAAERGAEPSEMMNPLIGYTIMLAALSLIFVAIKRQRDVAGGGVIKFMPAFLMGLGVSAVAGVLYVMSWELVLGVFDYDFAGDYAAMTLEQRRAAGASAEELAQLAEDLAAFQATYANPAIRMAITFSEIFPVGLLVSLVSAGLLRNSRFLPAKRGAA